MIFLKFLALNLLLLVNQAYCVEQKLSCIEKGTDITVTGFDARFYLSTGKKRKNHLIQSSGEKLKTFLNNQHFAYNRKTIVLIHGFLNNHRSSWVAELKDKLTEKRNLNVIQVDWSDAFFNKHYEVDYDYYDEVLVDMSRAIVGDYDYEEDDESDESEEDDADEDSIIPEVLNPLDYRSAALRTEKAAAKLTKLLIKISKVRPNPEKFLKNLHLIGHSLGAHVAGQTGRLIKEKTKVQVKRITGLDPAYPCFDPKKNPKLKLDANDAEFVDVIHSNSEPGQNDNFGTYEPLGDMDFYPHRGFNQPKCDLNRQGKSLEYLQKLAETYLNETLRFLTTTILNVDATNIALNYCSDERFDIICDHGEAPNYFVQSLSKDIYAVPTALPITEHMIPTLTNQLKKCAASNKCVKMGYKAYDYANSMRKTYYADTTI